MWMLPQVQEAVDKKTLFSLDVNQVVFTMSMNKGRDSSSLSAYFSLSYCAIYYPRGRMFRMFTSKDSLQLGFLK